MKFLTRKIKIQTAARWLSMAAAAALLTSARAQDHGHLYISAYSQQAGAQLYFDNGNIFQSSSGYVKTLLLNSNPASRFLGRYDGNITVTPRSTNVLQGADYGANAAAPGSVIYFQIQHVAGPPGGVFEFWETTGTSPFLTVPVGGSATNLIKVTQANGEPGGNPWGHIHGRRFTTTVPGIYHVTFGAYDVSTNGPAAGPNHTPSAPITIAFQAGFPLASIARTNHLTTVKFATAVTHDFTVQASTNLTSSNWFNISGKLRGTDYFQTVQDTSATGETRFYRVWVEPYVP